jgi:hypothetical protein
VYIAVAAEAESVAPRFAYSKSLAICTASYPAGLSAELVCMPSRTSKSSYTARSPV